MGRRRQWSERRRRRRANSRQWARSFVTEIYFNVMGQFLPQRDWWWNVLVLYSAVVVVTHFSIKIFLGGSGKQEATQKDPLLLMTPKRASKYTFAHSWMKKQHDEEEPQHTKWWIQFNCFCFAVCRGRRGASEFPRRCRRREGEILLLWNRWIAAVAATKAAAAR